MTLHKSEYTWTGMQKGGTYYLQFVHAKTGITVEDTGSSQYALRERLLQLLEKKVDEANFTTAGTSL